MHLIRKDEEWFDDHDQHDAHDFLLFIVNKIKEAQTELKLYTKVKEIPQKPVLVSTGIKKP